MRFILVDTADARGCVALCQDATPTAVEAHPSGEDYSTWLLPAVTRLLSRNGLSLSELDGYAVCSGPGSFTGLRVGLTTVKAWAEIYPKPIAAVSRLAAFARLKPSSTEATTVAAYLDAHRDQVFAALYSAAGAVLHDESVTGLAAFLETVQTSCASRPVLWRTPDPQLLQSHANWPARQALGDLLESIEPPFAQQLAALAHTKFLQTDLTDSVSLDANYVRRSDAEIFWKGHSSAARI